MTIINKSLIQSYRHDLNPLQLYTKLPREEYMLGIDRFLKLLCSTNILHITHRPHDNLPIYSAPYIKAILSRYGEVEAVMQVAFNAFLVVFVDEVTARRIASMRRLGAPTGRLLTKKWAATNNMQLFYNVVKNLEKSAETGGRFSTLMDKDDTRTGYDMTRMMCRNAVLRTKGQGYSSRSFFCPYVTACSGPPSKKRTITTRESPVSIQLFGSHVNH